MAENRVATPQEEQDAFKQIEALVNSGEVRTLAAILTNEQVIALAEDWNEGRDVEVR